MVDGFRVFRIEFILVFFGVTIGNTLGFGFMKVEAGVAGYAFCLGWGCCMFFTVLDCFSAEVIVFGIKEGLVLGGLESAAFETFFSVLGGVVGSFTAEAVSVWGVF